MENAPTYAINRDFENQAMDPAVMAVYVKAVKDADLPVMVFLQAWQAGGRIPPDTDLKQLELDMMMLSAFRDAARQDALNIGDEEGEEGE